MTDASNPADVQAIVEDMFEHPLFRPWRSDEAMATVKAAIMDERDACARIAERYARYATTEHEAQMCEEIGSVIAYVPRLVEED